MTQRGAVGRKEHVRGVEGEVCELGVGGEVVVARGGARRDPADGAGDYAGLLGGGQYHLVESSERENVDDGKRGALA